MNNKERFSIYLVDDDLLFANNIKRLIEHKTDHVDVLITADPTELLNAATLEGIDVIVSDIYIPAMTGLEFIKRLRQINYDIPVILLTGTPSDDTVQEAMRLGAYAHLEKPPNTDVLIQHILRAVSIHRLSHLKRSALEEDFPQFGPSDIAGFQAELNEALAGLKLAAQPIVSTSDSQQIGYEVLIRPDHPRLHSAIAVVEAARELGLTEQFLKRVIELVGAHASSLPADQILFLNALPEDLALIPEILRSGPLMPFRNHIVFELSERYPLARIENITETLARMRSLGASLALDNFGTGATNINNFMTLEPEYVKVAHSQVIQLSSNINTLKLVEALLKVCKERGIKTVAEGVENDEQFTICSELGFDYSQGIFTGSPNPVLQ